MELSAEAAYLFRHSVLRDAAYWLQMPADRSGLHALAFEILEAVAAQQPMPDASNTQAEELAEHARLAQSADVSSSARLAARELHYLTQGARQAVRGFRNHDAMRLLRRIRIHPCAEGVARAQAGRDLAKLLYDRGDTESALATVYEAIAEAVSAKSGEVHARSLQVAGLIQRRRGDTALALQSCRTAAMLAEQGAYTRLRAGVLTDVGFLLQSLGRPDEAEAALKQAADCAQRESDTRAGISARMNLANLLLAAGRGIEAAELQTQLLELARQCDDAELVGAGLINVAYVRQLSGDLDEATRLCRRALELARRAGIRRVETIALVNIAAHEENRERPLEARGLFSEALELAHEMGDLSLQATVRMNLGIIARQLDEVSAAETQFATALSLAARAGHRAGEARILGELALLSHRQGKLKLAAQQVADACEMAAACGESVMAAHLRTRGAGFFLLCGEIEEARLRLAQAEEALASPALADYRLSCCNTLRVRIAIARAAPWGVLRDAASLTSESGAVEALRLALARAGVSSTATKDWAETVADYDALRTARPHQGVLLFRGLRAQSLSPGAIVAVLERLQAQDPAALSVAEAENPALLAEFRARTAAL